MTSGIMWHDMNPYDGLTKQNLRLCMVAVVVGIISRHGLTFEAHLGNKPNKTKLALYFISHYFHFN